jgi:NTP pyrophosphatase (non-canonical NTP hydrolase)
MNLTDAPINQTYVERANALDSAGTDSCEARYRITPGVIKKLIAVSSMLTELGEYTDQIKKHIFYGKALDLDRGPSGLGTVKDDTLWSAQKYLDLHDNVRVLHATLDLITESIEMHSRFMEFVMGQIDTLDRENLEEEAGDCMWYLALDAKALGHKTFDNFMMGNIAKLETRYPEKKWTQEGALNRDTKAEMQAMIDKSGAPGLGPLHPQVRMQMDPAIVATIESLEGQRNELLRDSENSEGSHTESGPVGKADPSENSE